MLSLDLNSKMLYNDDQSIHITKTEFLLLALLLKEPEQILARSIVLSACTLPNGVGSEQVLNLHVSRLRKKLREAGAGEYLFFTPGFGLSMNHPSTFGIHSENFPE
jgi:DNA-binding response OmpR family regulator